MAVHGISLICAWLKPSHENALCNIGIWELTFLPFFTDLAKIDKLSNNLYLYNSVHGCA